MTIILQTTVGSTLHGTSVNDGLEDLDLMSIVVESQRNFCGLEPRDVWIERTKPEGVRSEAGDVDHTFFGLRKYVKLVLKQNPTVMLPLFVPAMQLREVNRYGVQLRELKEAMVCRKVGKAYIGYMVQQTARMLGTAGQKNVTRPELIEKYGFDTKYAGHIIRLGFQGLELLETGHVTLPMPPVERDMVLRIRTGIIPLHDIQRHSAELIAQLEQAMKKSKLREEPDYKAVADWMAKTYMSVWKETEQ